METTLNPVGYDLPDPQREVQVSGQDELTLAVKNMQKGDRLVLAPGTYERMDYKQGWPYNAEVKSDFDDMLQITAKEPGTVTIHGAEFIKPSHIILEGIRFDRPVHAKFGSHHIHFVRCHSDMNNLDAQGFTVWHNNPGQFQFIDSVFSNIGGFGKPHGASGIGGTEHHLGNDWRIAGCTFHGLARDGIMFGNYMSPDSKNKFGPMRNITIEDNVFYDIQDDAIECDKWFENLHIRRNIIGGKEAGLLVGISLAPGGPGPIFVSENFISGYTITPIKFNTEVDDSGFTRDVGIWKNTCVQLHDNPNYPDFGYWGLYLGVPSNIGNLQIHNNNFLTRGELLVMEGNAGGTGFEMQGDSYIDNNRWYTTGEYHWFGKDDLGLYPIARHWDATEQKNIYSYGIEAMRGIGGNHNNAKWSPELASMMPIPIGNMPTDVVCKWDVPVAGEEPTPDPKPDPDPTPDDIEARVSALEAWREAMKEANQ